MESKQSDDLHIFEVNECDWVLAHDAAEARAVWLAHTGDHDEDSMYPEDEMLPMTQEELSILKYTDDDGSRTFLEQLELMKSRGEYFPQFFAKIGKEAKDGGDRLILPEGYGV